MTMANCIKNTNYRKRLAMLKDAKHTLAICIFVVLFVTLISYMLYNSLCYMNSCEIYDVHGTSMYPTINANLDIDDKGIVDSKISNPQINDIIMYTTVIDDKITNITKRLVATGGDKLTMVDEQDEQGVHRYYLQKIASGTTVPFKVDENYVVDKTSLKRTFDKFQVLYTKENIQEAQHKTTICIDAGHGGSNEGTKETYDGVLIKEKDINLVIAKKLQWYLEQNDNLNVIMTRTSDTDVSIGKRIDYAKGNNADYVISVHINSKSQDNINPRGCMVLMSCSRYQPSDSRFASIYDKENMLANAIIRNLGNIGIPIADDWNTEYTNGILQRTNTVNELYPDGSPADYYGLIYNGTYAGTPTIIIEHSFLSNENDYRTHFSTDSQLDALARADAQGIIEVVN